MHIHKWTKWGETFKANTCYYCKRQSTVLVQTKKCKKCGKVRGRTV